MAYTIPAAAQWPTVLRDRERLLQWIPDFGNEAGPTAIDGTRQYRDSLGGGLWRAAFSAVQLRTRPQVLAWFGLEITLRGGKVPVDVPLLLCRYQPHAASGPDVLVTSVGGWAARDMDGRVDLENCQELEAGMHFSVYDATTYGNRMHRIESVAAVGGQPTQRDIIFWPPSRFAVADNAELEFDAPKCVMRLEASEPLSPELELRKRADPNALFVEAF